MQKLTQAGDNLVDDLVNRYNLSRDAVIHMLIAVNNGGGSMAQFNCPELGGSGQWMQGGMTMVGDLFNHGLKTTVDNLCSELATGLVNLQVFPVIPTNMPDSNQWWPNDCGSPLSSGTQNTSSYAVFPGKLAVRSNNQVTVYDTLDHNIGGVSQQQGSDNSLTFSSQFGTIAVNQLPIISGVGAGVPESSNTAANFTQPPEPQVVHSETYAEDEPVNGVGTKGRNAVSVSTDEIIGLIEKLAKLRDSGTLTEQDFDAKKTELLARI